MDILKTLEAELRAQIENSRDREESVINQESEVVEFHEWTEGYYEGYRSGLEFALSCVLSHKAQQQIKAELRDSGVSTNE